MYTITLHLLSMLQERVPAPTFYFLFVEPGSRNWKSVSQRWFQCKLMFYSAQAFYWVVLFVYKTTQNVDAI